MSSSFKKRKDVNWGESEDSSLADQVRRAPPKFKNNAEAVAHYQKELQTIAAKFGLSTRELILKAEESAENNEELERALELEAVIEALQK